MHPLRAKEYATLLATLEGDASWSSRFSRYVDFVRLMASGDRNTAIHKAARPFVLEAQKWQFQDRWDFINGLCQRIDHRGHTAGSTPYIGFTVEIAEDLAVPTLLEALTRDPTNALAHLWLAIIPNRKQGGDESVDHFRAAHKLAPDDRIVTERYVDWLLYSVGWDTHHLPEGLLNDKDAVLADLDEIASLLHLLPQDFRATAADRVATFRAEVMAYQPKIRAMRPNT